MGFYVTHPAVNGGVELHIDTAVGIKELNLGDLQQLSEIDDELKDLWLENLPEEVTINALTIAMSLRASCAILPRKSCFCAGARPVPKLGQPRHPQAPAYGPWPGRKHRH